MTLSAAISKDSKRSVFVTGMKPRSLNQMGIQVSVQSEGCTAWRVSTSGGILRFWSGAYSLDEDIRGLTVAHVFDAGDEVQDSVVEATEVAFDDYDSDDECSISFGIKDTIETHDISKHASLTGDSHDPETNFRSLQSDSKSVELPSYTGLLAKTESRAVPTQENFNETPTTKQLEHLGFLEDPPIRSKEHDWALIDLDPRLEGITDPDALYSEENVPIYGKSVMLASEVWIATGRGLGLKGRAQSSLCAIKTKGSMIFVDVWVVQLYEGNTTGLCTFPYVLIQCPFHYRQLT